MAVTLSITYPDGRSEERELDDGRYYIGRDPQIDISLQHPSLAPTHALLEIEGREVYITSLTPQAPVVVNRETLVPFTRQLISLEGTISLGQIEIQGALLLDEAADLFTPPFGIPAPYASLDSAIKKRDIIERIIDKLEKDEVRMQGVTLRDIVDRIIARLEQEEDEEEAAEETANGASENGEEGAFKGGVLKAEEGPPADVDEVPERIVNTGFAAEAEAASPLDPGVPLTTEHTYYFWMEIGEVIAGSIETDTVRLQIDQLPPEATVKVALFSFDNELEIIPGQDVGELRILPSGAVRVATPVVEPAGVAAELRRRRLFFPVRTPLTQGVHRLRCNIYYEQILLQSRLVEALVMADPSPQPLRKRALKATADYVLSKLFDTTQLTKMPKHRLSLMLNDNGNGTHGFRFFGQGEFKNDAAFDGHELQNLIEHTRGALRKAAWGDEEEYASGKPYRYEGSPDLKRLRLDLLRCAIRGYRFYDALINRLAGDADAAWDLADLMIRPGQVQIASKQSARLVIPAAMFYDYPLDTGRKASEFTLCPEFIEALKSSAPLEDARCFKGNCPTYEDDTAMCPSGFWGFRHSLGLPVSVSTAPDAPVEIHVEAKPEFAVGVSTDPNFIGREAHEEALQALVPGLGWHYADSQDETIDLLKTTNPHIVYFFCHGGVVNDVPFIQVGEPGSRGITRDNLRAKRIRWREERPLVFINGCHTTALEPESAIDLVGGFIETSHAAGVIGTEITVFVPLARQFAEAFFRRFVVEGQPMGDALRSARLQLLKQGNPLGLVYIPYAMTGLRLARK